MYCHWGDEYRKITKSCREGKITSDISNAINNLETEPSSDHLCVQLKARLFFIHSFNPVKEMQMAWKRIEPGEKKCLLLILQLKKQNKTFSKYHTAQQISSAGKKNWTF